MSPMRLVARIAARTMRTWTRYGSKKATIRRRVRARRSLGIGLKSAAAPLAGPPPMPRRPPPPPVPPPPVAPPVAVLVWPRGKAIRWRSIRSSSRSRRYHGTCVFAFGGASSPAAATRPAAGPEPELMLDFGPPGGPHFLDANRWHIAAADGPRTDRRRPVHWRLMRRQSEDTWRVSGSSLPFRHDVARAPRRLAAATRLAPARGRDPSQAPVAADGRSACSRPSPASTRP